MQWKMSDIQTLEANVVKMGGQVTYVIDPNHKQASQPPQHPVGGSGSGSQLQDSLWAWAQAHPNDSPGTLQVKVLGRKAPESGLLDPVDVEGSGVAEYIAAHSS